MVSTATEKPPYFFLSYAHDSGDDDAGVRRFYEQLTHDVRLFSGVRKGAIGFCDVSLRVGDRWSAELVEHLSTTQVFVPILSPTYFASEACGKEWTVFTRRRPGGRSLVPLLWVPPHTFTPPAVAQHIQWRDAAFGPVYAQEGLRDLIRMDAHRDAYYRFVQALANRIVELYRTSPVPEHPDRPAFDDVPNAFASPAPAPRPPAESRPKVTTTPRHPAGSGMPRLNPADPFPKDDHR